MERGVDGRSGRRGGARSGVMAALGVALAAFGCRAAPAPEAAPSATQRALPSAAAPSSVPGAALSAAPTNAPASPAVAFHLVVPGKRVWLSQLSNALFALSERAIIELRGDEAIADPALLEGTTPCSGVYQSMAGSFPDDAWLSQGVRLSRFEQGAWRVRKRLPAQRAYLLSEAPGRALVGFVPGDPEVPTHYQFQRVPAASGLLLPKPAANPLRDPSCKTRLVVPAAIERASDGTLFAIGNDCRNGIPGGGAPLVELWAPGAASSRTTELADADEGVVLSGGAAFARGSSDIWVGGGVVGGGPFLVHFDGASWSRVPPPATKGLVTSISWPSRGSFWVTLGETPEAGLLRRDASGAWSVVPVPAAAGKPRKVVALSDDDVWLETEQGIFHTRPAKNAFTQELECVIVVDKDADKRMREP